MSNYKDSFGALLGKTLTMHIQQSNAKSDFASSCIFSYKDIKYPHTNSMFNRQSKSTQTHRNIKCNQSSANWFDNLQPDLNTQIQLIYMNIWYRIQLSAKTYMDMDKSEYVHLTTTFPALKICCIAERTLVLFIPLWSFQSCEDHSPKLDTNPWKAKSTKNQWSFCFW